jgi:hypothetical protein
MKRQIFNIIDINNQSIIFQKKDLIGIYFLIKDNKIIYIGKTTKGFSRVLEHKSKNFDKYCFFQVELKDLNYIEAINILHYKPQLNKDIFCYRDKTINEINTICKMIFGKKNIKLIQKIIQENNINLLIKNNIQCISKDDIYIILEKLSYEY